MYLPFILSTQESNYYIKSPQRNSIFFFLEKNIENYNSINISVFEHSLCPSRSYGN